MELSYSLQQQAPAHIQPGKTVPTRHASNGFALRTDNNEYYGTVENNRITHLCLNAFDCVDDEFALVATTWDLALVNWCDGSIITV